MLTELPKLPYLFDALEPYIDAQTMEIHYTKHHQAYLTKLLEALANYPELIQKDLDTLLAHSDTLPKEIATAVINNGGGVWNHNFFWQVMTPTATETVGDEVQQKISETFGSLDQFKEQFTKAALSRFGSGWAWLVVDKSGTLEITSTANQDTPISQGKIPLLNLDVWEHAYYLKYQNRRADYIKNWWNVVNWGRVKELYANSRT